MKGKPLYTLHSLRYKTAGYICNMGAPVLDVLKLSKKKNLSKNPI